MCRACMFASPATRHVLSALPGSLRDWDCIGFPTTCAHMLSMLAVACAVCSDLFLHWCSMHVATLQTLNLWQEYSM